MLNGKRIVVIMPAYNAERTLVRTYNEVVAQEIVDLVIVVDDGSRDRTAAIAKNLERAVVHTHESNRGYGANQKTCYRLALEHGADIVIMVHADYQYTPRLIPAMAGMIASGLYDCVIASRILGGMALKNGMPWWRYFFNRLLTLVGNLLLGAKVSEYHTGYRAFSGSLLRALPIELNSDDFVFDNQMLAQVVWMGHTVGEVSCPARYEAENSSISFRRSITYGLGCVWTAISFRLARWGVMRPAMFRIATRGGA
jgi:glycosyltransferase involved in cell wall biosynthesis